MIIALAGHWMGEKSRRVAMTAIGTSLAISIVAFIDVVSRGEAIAVPLYEFLRSGDLIIDMGLYIDQLTVLLLLLVTGVSFVVHVYSARYMIGDARYSRFFAVTTLFTFGMVTLVMSSNLLMMFMSWEIMGICSYLLISHQSDRPAACRAATKAFLVNAVADVGLLFGIVLSYATFHTLDIQLILDRAPDMAEETFNLLSWFGHELHVPKVTIITLLLFMGCLGKSAQVPFHVWLPYAMEAPTPVSALIHAATMVNAGPFLLVRFSALVILSPVAMTVIAIVGATTALFAAIVSLTQSDIKKILAYSTISQIGFMIMACGLGAFVAAIFHMMAHGFLKGFLFLSTGNQLEATGSHAHHQHASEESKPPWSLYLGALILACVPPFLIFTGPYESLWTVHNSIAAKLGFWVIGLLTVFFTAVYLFRGVVSQFHPHPTSSVRPHFYSLKHLTAIGVGALGLIGLLIGVWSWFAPFLALALAKPTVSDTVVWQPNLFLMLALPLIVAAGGWAFAYMLHLKPKPSRAARSSLSKSMYVLFLNKFYVDEIYHVFIVRPVIGFARWLWRAVDEWLINGLIFGTAAMVVSMARWLWQVIDVRAIDRTVEGTGGTSIGLARWLWEAIDVRRIDKTSEQIGQAVDATGRKLHVVEPRTLQHHLLVVISWLVFAIVFFYWLVL